MSCNKALFLFKCSFAMPRLFHLLRSTSCGASAEYLQFDMDWHDAFSSKSKYLTGGNCIFTGSTANQMRYFESVEHCHPGILRLANEEHRPAMGLRLGVPLVLKHLHVRTRRMPLMAVLS